ncbi:MAG TPA: glycoside hydrolase family 6 protein [Pilimelia sp.]|nr:glycoside hydrolase family 6 protein [Pilimelia sp.]
MRHLLRASRRRLGALIVAGTLIVTAPAVPVGAAQAAVPAGAAQAAVACDVTYEASNWADAPRAGGFQANLTIRNDGAPLAGWTLAFTLPAGQTFHTGWSADWTGTAGAVTASSQRWNARLGTGQSTRIGFLGRWSGSFTGDVTAFRLNGVPCGGGEPPGNQPPTVTLTSPVDRANVALGNSFTMAANATDPDGSVSAVQFFVNGNLVGTDTEAPYQIDVSTGAIGFGIFTASARAFDNGSPPLTGDSARVSFTVVTVPPLSIIAEPTALTVPAGGTGTFDLRLSAAAATAAVSLTVAGAPGVTVSPTALTFGPDRPRQQVTVSAAPGSAGGVATVTASADPTQRISPARVTVTVTDAAEPVANPYAGAAVYVNPDWAARARSQAATTPGALGQQMERVATYPTAVWLDGIDAITAGRGLAGHLDAALAQQRASGARAMVVQLVLYNIPGRDCMRRAAPGELTVSAADRQRYRAGFVDPIAAILGRPEYAGLRVVTVVEPDALASSVVAPPFPSFVDCTAAHSVYVEEIRYALGRLAALDNTYPYLDFSYSGLFGYPDNLTAATTLYANVVNGPGGPGAASVAGFVTNVRQYAPLAEPFIPSGDTTIAGSPVFMSSFFDFNRHIHELGFAQAARDALVARGFAPSVGMLVDTSRNGWGGPDRPTGPGGSTNVNTWVDESRIDRRQHRVSWCNQAGAGLGARPQAAPAPGVHAYAWVTPPGESDGVASAAAPIDADRPYLRHRNGCDPLWQEPRGAIVLTNALPGAPHAGHWFPAFFAQLVRNAHPPVPVP